MKISNKTAQVFVLMASILWGTTGSAQAFAPENANPIAIGAIRMVIGGTILFVIALMKGAFKVKVNCNKRLLLIAAISISLFQPLFFLGISKTGVALGTVLGIGSAPIFSGIIEHFMGNKISNKWIIATGISVTGCILLFSGQNSMNMNVFGAILAIGAGLSYAVYVKSSEKLLQHSKREAVNGLVFFISSIILLPVLFTNDLSWIASTEGVIISLHLGIVTLALAFTLFTSALVNISTPKAVTLTLAEPLTAAVLGIVVFNEKLSIISMVGVSLLFCGLIINSYSGEEIDKYKEKETLVCNYK